jgi:hypothetical protein
MGGSELVHQKSSRGRAEGGRKAETLVGQFFLGACMQNDAFSSVSLFPAIALPPAPGVPSGLGSLYWKHPSHCAWAGEEGGKRRRRRKGESTSRLTIFREFWSGIHCVKRVLGKTVLFKKTFGK